ncbi:DNA-binding transcriptional regulator, LysR family [Dyella sp. OK004]|uniref:LysR family transcriptional regulator n=1 Tax=Dyella sp. OK004 TaxID=1855292 RepID=UPI0008EA5CE5|nr:LysR family transcriptional regulator [Dyella sp. OK004]SFS03885.1 DNA-binding transcriptional regulator, LysR family [Dyella sp. OK004]
MNVELRYLHAFRAVCEAGSLRAAAATLHRTEQAVSYQLRKLEEALGMPLFHRGSGRLVPNPAGERLLLFCRDMGRDWARLHEEIRDAALPMEPLRISAVSGYGRYELLPLFRDGPLADIPIHMRYPAADEVMRHVESGACDLGFVHLMRPHERLSLIPVAMEEIVLVTAARNPLPRLDAAALGELAYITYEESDYVFATWFTQILCVSPGRLAVAAHFEELEEVLDWVASGRGVSIVPAACALDYEQHGEIIAVRKPDVRCHNKIYAVMDPLHRHPAVERTLAAVRERTSIYE